MIAETRINDVNIHDDFSQDTGHQIYELPRQIVLLVGRYLRRESQGKGPFRIKLPKELKLTVLIKIVRVSLDLAHKNLALSRRLIVHYII